MNLIILFLLLIMEGNYKSDIVDKDDGNQVIEDGKRMISGAGPFWGGTEFGLTKPGSQKDILNNRCPPLPSEIAGAIDLVNELQMIRLLWKHSLRQTSSHHLILGV